MGFADEVSLRAREIYCDTLVNTGVLVRALQPALGALPAALIWKIARDEYRKFCNREPQEVPPPPFPGGQCQFCYEVRITFTVRNAPPIQLNGTFVQTYFLFGPIGAPTIVPSGSGRQRIASINIPSHGSCSGQRSEPQVIFVGTPFSFPEPATATIDSVVVTPSPPQPDTCGDIPPTPPPSELPPPVPIPDFTYRDDDNNDINVPITLIFGFAYLDADLNLNIPVSIDLNANFDIPVTIPTRFDINFNVGNNTINIGPTYNPTDPRNPSGGGPGRPGNYGPNDPPPPTPPNVPEPPPEPNPKRTERAIRGVLVTTTSIAEGSSPSVVGQDVNPDVYVPDLGLVSFLIRVSGASGGWTEDIRVKNRRQFIPCPWEGGAIDVRGTPRQGIEFTLTPVFGVRDVSIR